MVVKNTQHSVKVCEVTGGPIKQFFTAIDRDANENRIA